MVGPVKHPIYIKIITPRFARGRQVTARRLSAQPWLNPHSFWRYLCNPLENVLVRGWRPKPDDKLRAGAYRSIVRGWPPGRPTLDVGEAGAYSSLGVAIWSGLAHPHGHALVLTQPVLIEQDKWFLDDPHHRLPQRSAHEKRQSKNVTSYKPIT